MLVALPPQRRPAYRLVARNLPGIAVAIVLLTLTVGAPSAAGAGTPQLSASPVASSPGTAITVGGAGFPRNSRGYVTLDAGASGPAYHANGKGSFSVLLAIPIGAALGGHAVAARVDTSVALATTSITVVTATPAPTAAPTATATPTTAPTATPAPTPAATLAPSGGYGATDGVICDGRLSITQSGSSLALPYCSSRSLFSPSTTITRAVVVVHGDSRNAPDHLRYITSAAAQSGVTDALVVAPQFLVAGDLSSTGLRASALYWTSGGWKQGDRSSTTTYSRAWSMSSFAVLDELLATIGDRAVFPNLREVVVVGHSAGGQLADRFAASTRQAATLAASGIEMRYIVANPSSYLYFDPSRLHPTTGLFSPLSTTEQQACPSYDTYKYGLSGLNSYVGAVGAATLKSQYGARRVTYLLGTLDTDPSDASLDSGCAAEWQGSQRLERGITHFRYLGIVLGQTVYGNHVLRTVLGVGHDARSIYMSPEGQNALFASPG